MESARQQGPPSSSEPPQISSDEVQAPIPAASEVYNYLLYSLSLPERALRATSAVVGGTLQESAALLVPQAFRTSKSYETFVQQMLDFVVRDVGRVARDAEEETPVIEGYIAKKAVSGFLDLAGMATLHVSPMTVLAIVNDVAYGSQTYLNELSAELKKAGVIDETSTIHHAADLLDAVRDTSGTAANAFDQPPLSVEGLKETLRQTIEKVGTVDPTKLIPQSEMQQIWNDMHEMAAREQVGVLDVSSTMSLYAIDKIGKVGQGALSSVTVAGNLFDRHIFEHYRQGLGQIREHGIYATLAATSGPYIAAVWTNFSTEKETLTEDLLTGKLLGRAWEGVRGWFGNSEKPDSESSD